MVGDSTVPSTPSNPKPKPIEKSGKAKANGALPELPADWWKWQIDPSRTDQAGRALGISGKLGELYEPYVKRLWEEIARRQRGET